MWCGRSVLERLATPAPARRRISRTARIVRLLACRDLVRESCAHRIFLLAAFPGFPRLHACTAYGKASACGLGPGRLNSSGVDVRLISMAANSRSLKAAAVGRKGASTQQSRTYSCKQWPSGVAALGVSRPLRRCSHSCTLPSHPSTAAQGEVSPRAMHANTQPSAHTSTGYSYAAFPP